MDAQDGAHLVVPQSFDVPQHERLTVEGRQRLDPLVELPGQLALLERPVRCVLIGGLPR